MAQAADHHTPIELSLDDYHHHLQTTLGYGINAALREMERRIATGRLLLKQQKYDANGNPKGDAVVIRRLDFSVNYNLKFDMGDHVRVVPRRRPTGLLPGDVSTIRFDPSDPNGSHVAQLGLPKDDFDYTVVERPDRSPTSQQESLKSKAWQNKPKAEGWQVRRIKQVLKEAFPPDGLPPNDMPLKTVRNRVNVIFERRRWKPASVDSVARAMGRRRA
jgi:hypothetical protein